VEAHSRKPRLVVTVEPGQVLVVRVAGEGQVALSAPPPKRRKVMSRRELLAFYADLRDGAAA
jgi:hypothetical protein